MKNFFVCIVFSLLLLTSCVGKIFEPVSEKVDLDGSLCHDMIELGEQLNDPYTVENMTQALASLYPTKADRVPLEATHIYVRLLPESQEQYDLLSSLGVIMTDHPLDYRIVREGDYYHDPSVPDDRITWQYAVVEPDFYFPPGIVYEKLEDCYIVDEQLQTRADGIDWAAVEREAYRLTGNEDLLPPPTRASQTSCPQGRITITDPAKGTEGVKGVMVSCNTFVKFANAYTDEDGCYTMRSSFSSDPRYRLVFKNRKGFSIGLNLILVPASVSTLGEGPASGISCDISSDTDGRMFQRAVVNNAAYDYYTSCLADGRNMSTPPTNLRIWLFRNMGGSSAAMVHQGALIDNGLIAQFLGEYASLVKLFLPDVTLGLKEAQDFASIYLLTIHELAHASHFMKVGTDFWDPYIQFILSSFVTSGFVTYGVGIEKDHGYCEVGEMWAYYVQTMFLRERYADKSRVFGSSYWFAPQVLVYLDERGLNRWKIFSALGSDSIDKDSFQDKLISLYPEMRSTINQAFGRYY